MASMKIPGVLWTTAIAVAIFACQTLLPEAYASYGSIGVVFLMGLAKTLDLQPTEVEKIVKDLHAASPRGTAVPVPKPRGKVERWLVG